MSIVLCIILFVVFAVAQLLFTKKATHKVVKYVPMLVSAIGTVAAIGLHAYALITYHMGTASESVLAENQYFATFILVPAGICLVGSIIGFLIAKKVK